MWVLNNIQGNCQRTLRLSTRVPNKKGVGKLIILIPPCKCSKSALVCVNTIYQTGDSWQDTQYHKGMEIEGRSHCPDSHLEAAENTNPHHCWERWHLLEFTMSCGTGWFTSRAKWGEQLNFLWDPVVLLQDGPVEIEHALLKEERMWGSWSGISCSQSNYSHLTVLPPYWHLRIRPQV